MSACGGSGLGVLREKAVRHESRTTSAPAVRQIISKNFGIHVSYGMTMKQILTTALAAWLAGNLAAGAVEELPALPVPPQDAPGGAAFANENIVHDDGTGAQISFFLPTHDKRGSLEVEYTSYNIIVVKNGRFLLLEDLSGSKTEDGKAFFGKIIIPSEFIDSAEIGMWGSPRNSSLGIEKKLKVSTFKKILREKSWTDQKSATEGGTIRLESNRDAATAISRIRAVIKADLTFDKLSEILGEPDMDIGSGIHIFVYRLSDGTGIRVGTPDKKAVSYVFQADNRLFPIEAGQAPGGQHPFDEVLWVERPKPEISVLYLVLTNTGGHDENVRLIVRHASAALREAEKHQGQKFNVGFFVRPSEAAIGFAVEQLREIAAAAPKRAEELVRQHTWSIEELPKPAAQGGAIRPEPESTAPTPRDMFPRKASGEQSDHATDDNR